MYVLAAREAAYKGVTENGFTGHTVEGMTEPTGTVQGGDAPHATMRTIRRFTLLITALSVLTLAFGAGSALAKPCWQRLIDDWWDGRIDNYYSPACVRAAIKHAPNDLREYSDLPTDLRRMLQGPLVKDGKNEVIAAGAKGRSDAKRETSSADPTTTNRDPQGYSPASSKASGPIPRAIRGTEGGPSSLPIPLLALGGLALLLLASGATGLVTRRIRARRAGGGPPTPGG
jgi:hypothetical protein